MSYTHDNNGQTTRLRTLLSSLNDDQWSMDIGDGWTVGSMLCHLAFWDKMTTLRLLNWKTTGRLAVVLDAENIKFINDSNRSLALSMSRDAGMEMVLRSAEEIDAVAAQLDAEQIQALDASGRDRWYKRSLHRQTHLDRIEAALKGKGKGSL